jgi:hypothetical protein
VSPPSAAVPPCRRPAPLCRFAQDDAPTLVKDLLNHVRKNGFKGDAPAAKGGGGGKKGKKGKGKQAAAAADDDDDGDGDGDIAALLAQMAKGSDDEDVEIN